MCSCPRGPRYNAQEARLAIAASRSWSEALRRLGMCRTGGATPSLGSTPASGGSQRITSIRTTTSADGLSTTPATRGDLGRALDLLPKSPEEAPIRGGPQAASMRPMRTRRSVARTRDGHDTRSRQRRLRRHRLENLRIVCPNCAATLDTHCARKRRLIRVEQDCVRCGRTFRPRDGRQRYCSRECGMRWDRSGMARPASRKVDRPPHAQLSREVHAIGFCATGRRYGVTDNAIRKWLRQYELEGKRAKAA